MCGPHESSLKIACPFVITMAVCCQCDIVHKMSCVNSISVFTDTQWTTLSYVTDIFILVQIFYLSGCIQNTVPPMIHTNYTLRPLIRLRHMALYECVLTDWWVGWLVGWLTGWLTSDSTKVLQYIAAQINIIYGTHTKFTTDCSWIADNAEYDGCCYRWVSIGLPSRTIQLVHWCVQPAVMFFSSMHCIILMPGLTISSS